jgi:MFS family permease
MTWLIGARAMQGFGGGSILSLTQIIVGDIVPLQQRGVGPPCGLYSPGRD